jgi:hypothetical protein
MVLVRSAASAAGGVTRLPPMSRAWRLHMTLRQAPSPAVPAAGRRRGALPVPVVQLAVRAAPSVRRVLANLAGGVPAGETLTVAGLAVASDLTTATAQHTVQRIVNSGRRVEERIAPPDRASRYPHRPDLGWTPGPPPMAAAQPPQPPAREHGRGAAEGPAPEAPDSRRTLDAPPIDVERLADQVVRRINDRIIAHRERLGRI